MMVCLFGRLTFFIDFLLLKVSVQNLSLRKDIILRVRFLQNV